MDGGEKFFTFNGSEYRGEYGLTASQEDYLEMICRNCPQSGSVRLGVLARKINVSESSASKMVHKLSETGLVTFEKYGTICFWVIFLFVTSVLSLTLGAIFSR